jgi:uncharacterized protein
METLWRRGRGTRGRTLILLQQGSVATLLVSPSAVRRADLDTMQREAALRGFNVLATPRRRPANPMLRR